MHETLRRKICSRGTCGDGKILRFPRRVRFTGRNSDALSSRLSHGAATGGDFLMVITAAIAICCCLFSVDNTCRLRSCGARTWVRARSCRGDFAGCCSDSSALVTDSHPCGVRTAALRAAKTLFSTANSSPLHLDKCASNALFYATRRSNALHNQSLLISSSSTCSRSHNDVSLPS